MKSTKRGHGSCFQVFEETYIDSYRILMLTRENDLISFTVAEFFCSVDVKKNEFKVLPLRVSSADGRSG